MSSAPRRAEREARTGHCPRVERVDDLVVDSQGLDPPTDKWLQAAREAADTDGIRENAYAERLQMCISCCTLMCMFPMVPNMYRVSHSRYVSERVSPSYSTTGIGPFYKNMESLPVAPVPPKSLPRHSRIVELSVLRMVYGRK